MAQCNAPINYTGNVPIMSGMDWESQPNFKYSLFGSFHKAANSSLNWIFPNHEDYQGYTINPCDPLDFSGDRVDVDEIVWSNRGPLAFAILGLVLAAVITIFGIGWCCMKCCSCCCSRKSSRSSSDRYNSGYRDDSELLGKFGYEERKEKRVRICCGVTLIVWTILSIASLGSLFAFNNQLREGIDGITVELEYALNDAEVYLRTTQRQVNGILVTSYGNLSDSLYCVLDEMGYPKSMNSSIMKFQELTTLSQQLDGQDIERNLNLTIESVSDYCGSNTCESQEELTKRLANMVSTLDEITATTRKLEKHVSETLPKLYMTNNLLAPIDEVKEDIRREGQVLHEAAQALTSTLDEVIDAVVNARVDLKDVEREFDKVNPSLYASILVVVLFLLLVSILFFTGGLLSFFSKSNNVGTKSRSFTLNCGLTLIFLFGGILWIFTMACFLLSGVITQVVPANLRFLESNSTEDCSPVPRVPASLAGAVGVQADSYILPSYGFIAKNCREQRSAYVTFQLHQTYDIDKLEELNNLKPPSFTQTMNSDVTHTINGILEETSNLTVNLKHSQDQMVSLTGDLDQILTTLQKLTGANDSNDDSKSASVLRSMRLLETMRTTELKKLQTGLESLSNILSSTIADLSKIKNDIRATPEEKFTTYVAEYIHFAFTEILFNVGECQPMYHALTATINLFTYKIGSPIAGFWFSLNIVMLLFFPSIITAIVLQRL